MADDRCQSCLGMGYKGRWQKAPAWVVRQGRCHIRSDGKYWYVGVCPRCRGSGQRQKREV